MEFLPNLLLILLVILVLIIVIVSYFLVKENRRNKTQIDICNSDIKALRNYIDLLENNAQCQIPPEFLDKNNMRVVGNYNMDDEVAEEEEEDD